MALGLLTRKIKEINRVVLLPLDEIASNPNQPRKYFDDASIRELAESIRENGLLQPITVRKAQDCYELVAGERRTLAFRMLGRQSIPAIIEDYSEDQSAVLALIENLQRENLNYFEQAFGIFKLMKELQLTQQQVSMKLGMAQSTVANKLRLLQYNPQVQELFLEKGLTERHARAMLRISEARLLLEAIEYVSSRALNVEQTERYVDSLLAAPQPPKKGRLLIIKDMRIFLNSINKAIGTMQSAGIEVVSGKHETEEYLEYQIRIPKASVYKRA